jgi:hypothetical protein
VPAGLFSGTGEVSRGSDLSKGVNSSIRAKGCQSFMPSFLRSELAVITLAFNK